MDGSDVNRRCGVRIGVWLALLAALAGACEGKPERRRQRPAAAAPEPQPQRRAEPAPAAQAPQAATDDGLVPVTGPDLLERVRRSGRKATLVNAWASWCGPCKRELPMLAGLVDALAAENVGLMLVSLDEPAARKEAAALIAPLSPRPAAFIVEGPVGPFKRALNPAWKGAVPSTFLLDAQGELLYFWPGPVVEHELSTIVSAYLAGQPLEGPVLVEPGPPAQ